MRFQVEFTTRAIKDLKSLPLDAQKKIAEESVELEGNPFPLRRRVKRIQGIKFPCYRLRVDCVSDSYRVFYGIDDKIVYVLRIVSKKDAERIIRTIRSIDFPPGVSN